MNRTHSLPPYVVAALLTVSIPVAAHAQSSTGSTGSSTAGTKPPVSSLTPADIKLLAETHIAIGLVHDSADARAAQSKNKTKDAQLELAQRKREAVAQVLTARGLTEDEYQRRRFVVSTNLELRTQFDSVVAKITGVPIPGRVAVAAAPGFVPAAQLPPGLVGTHIGHVTTSYVDTPDKMGLLPMAFAEAAVASQHATLATRTPTNLAAMQMHAGHVLNALDPSLMKEGPGKGYGLKKAAGGVAQHIELAAKETGASGGVKIHATHIAAAARGTLTRVDAAVALIKQIQSATEAKEAAALISQLASLCNQLAAGADTNADGRVDWGNGEGGLQQAQEHVQLLIAGERK
ncbi:MAG: hypothetical protein ACOVSI_06965 [Gemmatimonas sp.]|jgi:hypothetical protein